MWRTRDFIVIAFMLLSLIIASVLRPTASWYARLGKPNYEQMIPRKFGDWVSSESTLGVVPPIQADDLKSTYSQTVSRQYIHRRSGRVVMLSIAYDDVQLGARQIHRPESCYSSQGFAVSALGAARLRIADGFLPGFRMWAVEGDRSERVTYWIRVGDRLIAGPSYVQSFTRIKMNLKGIVADALLVRVSEISTDTTRSDALQDQFIMDLLSAVAPEVQLALIGRALQT
jgi:EpsI family protein